MNTNHKTKQNDEKERPNMTETDNADFQQYLDPKLAHGCFIRLERADQVECMKWCITNKKHIRLGCYIPLQRIEEVRGIQNESVGVGPDLNIAGDSTDDISRRIEEVRGIQNETVGVGPDLNIAGDSTDDIRQPILPRIQTCFVVLPRIDQVPRNDHLVGPGNRGVPDNEVPGPSFVRPANPKAQKIRKVTTNKEPTKKVTRCKGLITPAFNESNVQYYSLGKFDHACKDCQALFFRNEGDGRTGIFSLCCGGGGIVLPRVKQPPPNLKRLACGTDDDSRHFLNNIRHYNNSFAMSCFKAEIPELRGQGPYVFRVHGQVYHGNGHCCANEGEDAVFGQIYFLDSDEAVRRRLNIHQAVQLRDNIVRELEEELRNVNPWARGYLMMKEVIGQQRCEEFAAIFDRNIRETLRNLDLPVLGTGEIAAVIRTAPGTAFETSHVGGHRVPLIVYPRQGGANQTSELKNLNPAIDPTVYPLLFPHGDFGYEIGLPLRRRVTHGKGRRKAGEEADPTHVPRRTTISIREFYQFKIQERRGEINLLHFSGKLYQQYLTDAMIRIDRNELWWYEQNQDKLRLDSYNNVRAAVTREANDRGVQVGRIALLPSKHPGSPRYPHYNYMESMAIISKHGKPCLFITFTCNPQWKELAVALGKTNQSFRNRPDLVNRIFYAKFLQFIDDFTKRELFGKVLNYIYSIEFQKRGLPHAHILFTFSGADRVTDAGKIDQLICAELPDRHENPILFAAVVKHMLHGKCGTDNPQAPCMREASCSKFFPKEFSDHTVMDGGKGRPRYKRSDNGLRIIANDGRLYDNRWVVPYNPYLLIKYDCHINVEACSSIKSIKYLNKYIYKGFDQISMTILPEGTIMANETTMNYSEIVGYERRRYINAWEASWRIMNFPLAGRSHHIEHLPVHVKDEHTVMFPAGSEHATLDRDGVELSKLTQWFALNQDNTIIEVDGDRIPVKLFARNYLYPEIPDKFLWDSTSKKWEVRIRNTSSMGLLADVPLRQTELFHLRLLLLNRRGATSWDDLKTVDGVLHGSFTEACRANHLIENKNEYLLCMENAAVYKTPHALRRLFAYILLVAPADAEYNFQQILTTHMTSLSEDLFRRFRDREAAEAEALHLINDIVRRNSEKSLIDFALPLPDRPIQITTGGGNLDDLAVPSSEQHARQLHSLTEEQRRIFNVVIAGIRGVEGVVPGCGGASTTVDVGGQDDSAGNLIFVDGPGGTGKTYLFSRILDDLLIQGKTFICMAWTGIAALLLKDGRTVHKTFSLQRSPDGDATTSVCLRMQSAEAEEIKRAALIVLDEASMVNVAAFDAIDQFLRILMNKPHLPMGGKIFLLGGDFRQVLPIVPFAGPREVMAATIKCSPIWRYCLKFRLTKNLRLREGEDEWAKYLIQIGNDDVQKFKPVGSTEELVEFPPNIQVNDVDKLIKFTFGEDILSEENCRAAILCPTNDGANEINEAMLGRVPGEAVTFYSNNACQDPQSGIVVPQETLNSVVSPSLPPHVLSLKVGCLVKLLRNLDLHNGLCNGTRLRVLGIQRNCLRVRILTGSKTGDIVFLPRMKISVDRDRGIPIPMSREQFPVRLAYGMTINKAQGQTLSKVGVYLKTPCFAHGQLYVALSRAQSKDDIKILIAKVHGRQGKFFYQTGVKFTPNVVYRDILGEEIRVEPTTPNIADQELEQDAREIEMIPYLESIEEGAEEEAEDNG